jgi:hypothetical protein
MQIIEHRKPVTPSLHAQGLSAGRFYESPVTNRFAFWGFFRRSLGPS